MNKPVRVYEPLKQCAKCKGKCCKRMGCHFSPTDFEETSYEYLKDVLYSGFVSIDWWDERDGSQGFYLRMRHIGAPVVDPSWGGRCVMLTDDGCLLSFEERPLGGRALKPSYDEGCHVTEYGKYECKKEWEPYHDILQRLHDEFIRLDVPIRSLKFDKKFEAIFSTNDLKGDE